MLCSDRAVQNAKVSDPVPIAIRVCACMGDFAPMQGHSSREAREQDLRIEVAYSVP